MLQPEEIQKVTFEQSVFSGYKKEDVDEFLDKVYAEYSRLYKENSELVEKLKVCIAKIEEYRADEKFLKSAIVNAQKLNETAMQEIALKKQEVEDAARKQADAIVTEAKDKAQQLTDESNQKIADFREKNTREFAQQQLEQANAFAAKKREYEAMIQDKQCEFDALQQKVDMFKVSVLNIFEQQIDLLNKFPEIEKTAVSAKTESEEVSINEVEANDISEEEIPVDASVEQFEAFEENIETQDTLEELSSIDDTVIDEEITYNTTVADNAEDEAPESKLEKEFEAEQIDIEELISVKPSPVEPETLELPLVDDVDDDLIPNDEAEDEEGEEEFHLFGSSPLVFSADIPESDKDDISVEQEKNSRFKKKLKFGVDFDVKKDR